ncbi:MAG: hypothetical protein J3K34DRAFT_145020 [Monoraphidium minutum]|nr:MAG: hypothetical protein J3K34DRAFT_145020 [Monoraphidium minutum]
MCVYQFSCTTRTRPPADARPPCSRLWWLCQGVRPVWSVLWRVDRPRVLDVAAHLHRPRPICRGRLAQPDWPRNGNHGAQGVHKLPRSSYVVGHHAAVRRPGGKLLQRDHVSLLLRVIAQRRHPCGCAACAASDRGRSRHHPPAAIMRADGPQLGKRAAARTGFAGCPSHACSSRCVHFSALFKEENTSACVWRRPAVVGPPAPPFISPAHPAKPCRADCRRTAAPRLPCTLLNRISLAP